MGFYKKLHEVGAVTSEQFAQLTNCNHRFLHEWMLQNASSGLLSFNPDTHEFELKEEYAMFLVDKVADNLPDSELTKLGCHGMIGIFQAGPGLVSRICRLDECFKTGRGVDYDDGEFSEDLNMSIHRMHRLICKRVISQKILSHKDIMANCIQGSKTLEEALNDDSSKLLVADFGCGVGQSILEMAKNFPNNVFHGLDISEKALELGNKNKLKVNAENVAFINPFKTVVDESVYDLAFCFDVVHDTAKPLEFLRSIRSSLKPGCPFVCVDTKPNSDIAQNINNPFAAVAYGYSLGLCLQCSMSEEGSAGLGTLGVNC